MSEIVAEYQHAGRKKNSSHQRFWASKIEREREAVCGIERCCMEIHGDPLDLQMEISLVFWETGNDKVIKRWHKVWPVSNWISSKDSSSSSFDWFMYQRHNQKVLGFIPVWVFSWYSRFLPPSKKTCIWRWLKMLNCSLVWVVWESSQRLATFCCSYRLLLQCTNHEQSEQQQETRPKVKTSASYRPSTGSPWSQTRCFRRFLWEHEPCALI